MKDSALVEITKVVGVNASAVGVMFTHLNESLTSLALTLSSIYTLYKLYKEIKTKK